MKKFSYYHLLFIIIILSLISIIFVNYTYHKLEKQLQSKLTIVENEFVVGDYSDQYFNFNRTIFNTIDEIKYIPTSKCNFIKDVSPKPISISEERGIYSIEIFNPNKSENKNCFNSILNLVKMDFIENIKNKMDQLYMQQSIKNALEAQRKEERIMKLKEITLSTKKLIFSDFLKLVKNNKIQEVGITEDFIKGVTINNEKFYTISRDVSKSDYLIKLFIEEGLNYYFIIDEYSSKNKIYREVYYRQTIEDQVKLSFLERKITQSPIIITSETHNEVKLDFKIYTLIVLTLFNTIGIIIFIFINRTHFKPLFKFLKKIS